MTFHDGYWMTLHFRNSTVGEIVTIKSRVTDHVGGRNALTGACQ